MTAIWNSLFPFSGSTKSIRLVEEHGPGRDGERPCDRDMLLLSTGEPMREVIRVVSKADAGQEL